MTRPISRFPWLSLLLALVVCACWARSRVQADMLAFFTRSGNLQLLASHRGCVVILVSNLTFREERQLSFEYDHTRADTMDEPRQLLRDSARPVRGAVGFEYASGALPPAGGATPKAYSFVAIPYWFLGLVTQAGALRSWWRQRREYRRFSKGQCVRCGYDLRATTGGRCPECAAAV